MKYVYILPKRQKILLSICLSIGIFIFSACPLALFDIQTINILIVLYSIGIPLVLHSFFMKDLDKIGVFIYWAIFSILLFIAGLIHNNGPFLSLTPTIDYQSQIYTTSLKTLSVFLIVYYIFNLCSYKLYGRRLLNTFRAMSLVDDDTQYKIKAVDVVFNILVVVVICIAALGI